MERDAAPSRGADLPRVTEAVWEQMAAAKRLLERLGAIRAAPADARARAAPTPAPPKGAINVAAGWGRDAR
jgi:hypothetical protein